MNIPGLRYSMPPPPEARQEIIVGALAASLSTLVCHPIDVIRTRLQVERHSSPASCLRNIIREDGVAGLGKGLSAPLIAQGVYKSVIFGVNSTVSESLRRTHPLHSQRLTYAEVFVCGLISGAVNSAVVAPVELVRNRLVVLGGTGPLQCASEIVRSHGLFGLWKGWWATVLRDGPGVGAWFLTFAACKDGLRRTKARDEPLRLPDLLFAGAAAGCAFWVVALPLDTIRTRLQVSDERSIMRVMMSMWREDRSIRPFFRGWQAAFGRAIPGSSITLATVDLIRERV